MRNSIFIMFLISIVAISCNNNSKKGLSEKDLLRNDLQETEKKLYSSEDADPEAAKDMIGKYISFANKYPDDEMTPEYLFKAAEIAMNFEQPHNSIRYLTTIEEKYKSCDKYAASIFLKAFIYDNYLKNYQKAEDYYNLFLDNYPNHPFAKDAEASLMILGIDDDDLINLFGDN